MAVGTLVKAVYRPNFLRQESKIEYFRTMNLKWLQDFQLRFRANFFFDKQETLGTFPKFSLMTVGPLVKVLEKAQI